jgi:hypothetical protein
MSSACVSRIRGVRAPLCFMDDGVGNGDADPGECNIGEVERFVGVLVPLVAAMDGGEGGPGDRVKYTTFARDPPIYEMK